MRGKFRAKFKFLREFLMKFKKFVKFYYNF